MRKLSFKSSKQNGFMIAELGIAMVLAAMAVSYYLTQKVKENQDNLWDNKAVLVGESAKLVGDSTKTYSTQYFTLIQRGLPITSPSGYVIPANRVLTPTLADLVAVANLSTGVAQPIVYANQNIGFAVQLSVDTSNGCVVPTCNLRAVVRTTAPIVDPKNNAVIDVRRASIAANTASAANAGVALPETPAIFSGQGGINVAANTANVAGLIGVRSGYDSSGMMEFDRRDGSLPRTGDIRMQDSNGIKHSIENAARVTTDELRTGQLTANTLGVDQLTANNISTNNISTGTGSATEFSATNLSGANLYSTNSWHGALNANSISTPSTWSTYLGASTVNSDTVIGNRVHSNSRVTAAEYLEVAGWATEGTWCEKEGLMGRSNGGSILSCQSWVWRKISSGGGFGKTWANYTSQRAMGTTYYNHSDVNIMVAVTTGNTVHQGSIAFYVDGQLIYHAAADMIDGPMGGSVLVPPGSSYSVGGGPGVALWMELR